MVWEGNIFPQDVGKRSVAVLSLKWRCTVKHFVNQDAQRPPIDSARVAAALDNLWRNVFFRADKRVGSEVGDT